MNTIWKASAAVLFAVSAAASASAQSSITSAPHSDSPIEEYIAFIGPHDLYSSDGLRLTRPWQIIRQDRANYHYFGQRDAGDTSDTFFASRGNRASLESMLADGFISSQAARDIVAGGAFVRVQIIGRGFTGRFVQVEVAR
jgi:hypothetical protein